jgi:4-amino-4-deoxy-L-arabinose transferase-like glycosyltransferase
MTDKDKLQDRDPTESISPAVAASRHLSSPRLAIGILCFVLSLLFYYGSVLRVHLRQTTLLDLDPFPDAVEYFGQANSILEQGAPTIQISHDRLPSRYPPGYPILMVPWLKVLPQKNIILAPFRTNQTIGLLLLLGCFALYLRIGRPLTGGLATLLLATQPAFVTYSRASMSDLSGAAVAVLAFALVYLGLKSRRRGLIYCAAAVLGLSLSVRPQLLFFAPLLLSMALFPVFQSRARWALHCVLVLVVYALAASPYFILNAFEFGHPLKTGYDFWVPTYTERQLPFSVHNIPRQLAMIWSEITVSWDQFRVANLFGTGTYFVPAFVLLSVVGLGFLRFGRFEIAAILAGVIFFIVTLSYSFVDGRFYMPILFLLVAVAMLPIEWALGMGIKSRYFLVGIVFMTLFVFSCVGYPSQSGFPPTKGRSQAWDGLKYGSVHGKSLCYEAQKRFAHVFKDHPGVVLSDIDPVYLNALLPKRFVAAPIDGKHSYCWSRLWRYGNAEATKLVNDAITHNEPVYALLLPSRSPDAGVNRLPSLDGYTWGRDENSDQETEIMILAKNPTLAGFNPDSQLRGF